jgi:hypothetical protein
VNYFLKIPLKKIIEILEHDQRERIDREELELLADVPFEHILKLKTGNMEIGGKSQKVLDIFDKYYLRKY